MKYDYCEIHPALLLGAIGATVIMVNHNNNSRNILFYTVFSNFWFEFF